MSSKLILRKPFSARVAALALEGGDIAVGRQADNDVVFDDKGVSRRHARIFHDGQEWCVQDLGSTNGTVLTHEMQESEVNNIAVLRDGDRIRFGACTLRVEIQHDAGPVPSGWAFASPEPNEQL